jgi:hypothetical protein
MAAARDVPVCRICHAGENDDGVRVLASRIRPRGMTKAKADSTSGARPPRRPPSCANGPGHDRASRGIADRCHQERNEPERPQALQHLREPAWGQRPALPAAGRASGTFSVSPVARTAFQSCLAAAVQGPERFLGRICSARRNRTTRPTHSARGRWCIPPVGNARETYG